MPTSTQTSGGQAALPSACLPSGLDREEPWPEGSTGPIPAAVWEDRPVIGGTHCCHELEGVAKRAREDLSLTEALQSLLSHAIFTVLQSSFHGTVGLLCASEITRNSKDSCQLMCVYQFLCERHSALEPQARVLGKAEWVSHLLTSASCCACQRASAHIPESCFRCGCPRCTGLSWVQAHLAGRCQQGGFDVLLCELIGLG